MRNDIILSYMADLSDFEPTICNGSLHPKAIQGLELFNLGRYFEAHEALEAAWREEFGPVRDLYRGILQIGVVYLHISRHNYTGAIKVYHRCQKWLDPWPDTCKGISVGQLKKELEVAITALRALGQARIAEFDLSLLKPVHYSCNEEQ